MESAATPTNKPKRVRAVKPKAEVNPQMELYQAGAEALESIKAENDAKPRRYRKLVTSLELKPYGKISAEAAPTTHRERMSAVDARSAETRKRVEAEYAEKGYGPKPRTSYRWIGRRTKGLPFSRMVIDHVSPGMHGLPGIIHAKHPTRATGIKGLVATPSILQTFMPSLPPELAAAMLGTN